MLENPCKDIQTTEPTAEQVRRQQQFDNGDVQGAINNMFDRSTLDTKQVYALNRAYIQIASQGLLIWKQRYSALTDLPQELKDELVAEHD